MHADGYDFTLAHNSFFLLFSYSHLQSSIVYIPGYAVDMQCRQQYDDRHIHHWLSNDYFTVVDSPT